MGSWQTTTKHESNEINGGNRYTINDQVSLEQLNAITENSFYAVNKSEEALTKANSAFENNGTVVSVGGSPVTTLQFSADPQTQLNELKDKVDNVSFGKWKITTNANNELEFTYVG